MTEQSSAAHQGWFPSPKDLIPVAPLVAGAFAACYVVGYFLAFDISWFAFFTLPEHVVFALRALPIAIGLSSVFFIALTLFQTSKRVRLKRRLSCAWVIVLALTGLPMVCHNHAGMALTLWLIAICFYFYDRNSDIRTQPTFFLLVSTNMIIASVFVGWLSGAIWWLPSLSNNWWLSRLATAMKSISESRPMGLMLKESPTCPQKGHVIFAGGEAVLFYEFGGGTHLYRWDRIKELFECGRKVDCDKPCANASIGG